MIRKRGVCLLLIAGVAGTLAGVFGGSLWSPQTSRTWAGPWQDELRQTVPTLEPTWPSVPSPSPLEPEQPTPTTSLPTSPEASHGTPGTTPIPTLLPVASTIPASTLTSAAIPTITALSTPVGTQTLPPEPIVGASTTPSSTPQSTATWRVSEVGTDEFPSPSAQISTAIPSPKAPMPTPTMVPSTNTTPPIRSYVVLVIIALPVLAGGIAWFLELGYFRRSS